MQFTPIERAEHIRELIGLLRKHAGKHTLDSLSASPLELAGLKYMLQSISEATRSLPPDWKSEFGPEIDWHRAAGLSSVLRHDYATSNSSVLWNIYQHDLAPLEAAIDRMIAAHGSTS